MTWHLLLDYDEPEAVPGCDVREWGLPSPVTWREAIGLRLGRAGYDVVATCFERSTNGWHGKVELEPAPGSPMEIIALQAVCGSDPMRESCNVNRAREVQNLGAYAAGVLLRELATNPPAFPGGVTFDNGEWVSERTAQLLLEAALALRGAAQDSFWLDRWNTLYKPNEQRRRKRDSQS